MPVQTARRVLPLVALLALIACEPTHSTQPPASPEPPTATGPEPRPPEPTLPASPIVVVTFGDSNTDFGFEDATGRYVATSYLNASPCCGLARPDAAAPNHATQLAGKIEALWRTRSTIPLVAVNHGLSGTRTGTGTSGVGAPNAREAIDGITRFEAEVLGARVGDAPWVANGVARTRAVVPTPRDFAYVSIGTNDCRADGEHGYERAVVNYAWMIDQWEARGLPASHLLLATIPPVVDRPACDTPAVNRAIRALVAARGATLIDLSAFASSDDGHTWRVDSMAVGPDDALHYREWVRQWIAEEIVRAVQRG